MVGAGCGVGAAPVDEASVDGVSVCVRETEGDDVGEVPADVDVRRASLRYHAPRPSAARSMTAAATNQMRLRDRFSAGGSAGGDVVGVGHEQTENTASVACQGSEARGRPNFGIVAS